MATAKTTAAQAEQVKAPEDEERVEVFIPRGQSNEEPYYYASVNSVNYILPRGKKSMVPKIVALEIERSFEAQEMLDKNIEEMLEASK